MLRLATTKHACTRFLNKCINFILTKINLCYFAHFCKCNFLRPATLAFGRPRDGSRDDDGTRRAPKIQLMAKNCDNSNGDPAVGDRCAFDNARETALCPSSCQNWEKVGDQRGKTNLSSTIEGNSKRNLYTCINVRYTPFLTETLRVH